MLNSLSAHLQSPDFSQLARNPEFPNAFTRSRKLPLPTLLACLCGFRGGSVQSEIDSFFSTHLGADACLRRHVSDWALAKARAKLHVPALWDLNARLMGDRQAQGLLSL